MKDNRNETPSGADTGLDPTEMMKRRFIASQDFILRTIAGESVLVPVGSGEGTLNGMISANETFAYLWELFREERTIEEAAAMAGGEYEGDREQILEDILGFVNDCYGFGLIKEAEG